MQTWMRPVRALACCLVGCLGFVLLPAGPSWAHHAQPPGPIAAYNTFGWWHGDSLRWREEFHGRLSTSDWRIDGPGLVQNQHGMLTLNTSTAGTVSATLRRTGHTTGRWEMRLRSRRYSTSAADYRVRTELVPVGQEYCGAENIALEDYQLGSDRTNFYIRSLPANDFRSGATMSLHNDQWHTFGVEVTEHRIVWFVDAHALVTERRPAALSGVPLTVRFTMVAKDGARMNKSRMQMDWLRAWSLTGSSKDPRNEIDTAPATERGTYRAACLADGLRTRKVLARVRTALGVVQLARTLSGRADAATR